eukprot:437670-Pyramimonas_sp.AAC.1
MTTGLGCSAYYTDVPFDSDTEEGNDDCGGDLKGFGCSACYTDVSLDSDTEGDDEEETVIALLAGLPAESIRGRSLHSPN